MVKIIVDMPDLYEADEAASMIGIGYATLYRWIKAGKLIPVRVDRRTLVPISEIMRLRKKTESTADSADTPERAGI